jgi:hypothetical protein
MKNIRLLLLLLVPSLLSCTCEDETYNLGIEQEELCTDPTTGITVECRDFLTGEPLSGQPFHVVQVHLSSLLEASLRDTFRTDPSGRIAYQLDRDHSTGVAHRLRHISHDDWHLAAEYGIPEGCDNFYAVRLKRAATVPLEVRNESRRDLEALRLEISALPTGQDLGGIYRPRQILLENALIVKALSKGQSETAEIKVLPEERMLITYTASPSGSAAGRDTFFTEKKPQGYVLKILR